MTLGKFIENKRKEKDMTRNALAVASGISHTEIKRIETGDRKQPSAKVLSALAIALSVPQEDLMKIAGYVPDDNVSAVEKAFPGLKTEKQRQTVETIVDGLSRNADLTDDDLDDLCEQLNKIIAYAKTKTNPD